MAHDGTPLGEPLIRADVYLFMRQYFLRRLQIGDQEVGITVC